MPRKIARGRGGLLEVVVSGYVGFGGLPAWLRARAGTRETAGSDRGWSVRAIDPPLTSAAAPAEQHSYLPRISYLPASTSWFRGTCRGWRQRRRRSWPC